MLRQAWPGPAGSHESINLAEVGRRATGKLKDGHNPTDVPWRTKRADGPHNEINLGGAPLQLHHPLRDACKKRSFS
jgi:hypothetical protein